MEKRRNFAQRFALPYGFPTHNIPKGIHSSVSAGRYNIYWTCSQYASRHGWWITQHGPEKKEKKNQDECCKYKHLVFHGVDAKPAGFMITQQSTILSPVWQQVMQMCAAQQCSAALSAPFKSVQQAGHTGSLLWMKCWDAFLQDALSLITHLAGL